MENENTVLRFEHVTGRKKSFHLEEINFTMQTGYIYGLIGENGAGKTTLMKTILEENGKYDGTIFVGNFNARSQHVEAMNQVGYVSEEHVFFEACTAEQNAEILGLLYDTFQMDLFRTVMRQMKLSAGKIYGKMSRGERLKFQLAFAIAHQPSLYLLDEVTAGMDPVFRLDLFEILRQLIKDETCSILLTSHITSEIERETDYVAVMEQGRLSEWMESMDFINQWKKRKAGVAG
ncbi:MAG: ATP-binding cassette domain-containing protein [Lachnospiraceae bacterium]